MTISVLVADDSATIRRRAQTTLGDAGHEVHCVEDGEAAWNELEGGRVPSVVLCDILMPKVDGYELCRRIKEDDRFKHVPVMLLRGTFEPWDEARALEAGADGFITKPFEPENLVRTVSDILAAEEGEPERTEEVGVSGTEDSRAEGGEDSQVTETAEVEASAAVEERAPREEERAPREQEEVRPGASADPDATMLVPTDVAASALRGSEPPPPSPEPAIVEDTDAGAATAPAAEAGPFGSDDDPLALGGGSPEPAAVPSASPAAEPAPVAAGAAASASVDELAEKVAAKLATDVLERIAWEVVPDVAEALIRQRLIEIEAKLQGG